MLDVLFSSFFICIILEPTEMQHRTTRSAVGFLSGMGVSAMWKDATRKPCIHVVVSKYRDAPKNHPF